MLYNLSGINANPKQLTPIVINTTFQDTASKIVFSANRHSGTSDNVHIQIATPSGVGTQYTVGVFGGGEIASYWKQ